MKQTIPITSSCQWPQSLTCTRICPPVKTTRLFQWYQTWHLNQILLKKTSKILWQNNCRIKLKNNRTHKYLRTAMSLLLKFQQFSTKTWQPDWQSTLLHNRLWTAHNGQFIFIVGEQSDIWKTTKMLISWVVAPCNILAVSKFQRNTVPSSSGHNNTEDHHVLQTIKWNWIIHTG